MYRTLWGEHRIRTWDIYRMTYDRKGHRLTSAGLTQARPNHALQPEILHNCQLLLKLFQD